MDQMTMSFLGSHYNRTHQKALISQYTLQCEFKDLYTWENVFKKKNWGVVKLLAFMV